MRMRMRNGEYIGRRQTSIGDDRENLGEQRGKNGSGRRGKMEDGRETFARQKAG